MKVITRETLEPETSVREGVKKRARRTKVTVDTERREVRIETYLLGPRGADIFGGTATMSIEELIAITNEIVVAIN